MCGVLFFFFKQKTAYEIKECDWSSEVCSSDLRRFNHLYGDVFPIPKVKLTHFSRLPGVDGKRMSKSVGNVILLSDEAEIIEKKVMSAVTDTQTIRKNDPGRPEICNVFIYHQKFHPEDIEEVAEGCRAGTLGCVEHKKSFGRQLSQYLEPFRKNREYYLKHIDDIKDILSDGEKRAREVAEKTMNDVYKAMKMG